MTADFTTINEKIAAFNLPPIKQGNDMITVTAKPHQGPAKTWTAASRADYIANAHAASKGSMIDWLANTSHPAYEAAVAGAARDEDGNLTDEAFGEICQKLESDFELVKEWAGHDYSSYTVSEQAV